MTAKRQAKLVPQPPSFDDLIVPTPGELRNGFTHPVLKAQMRADYPTEPERARAVRNRADDRVLQAEESLRQLREWRGYKGLKPGPKDAELEQELAAAKAALAEVEAAVAEVARL